MNKLKILFSSLTLALLINSVTYSMNQTDKNYKSNMIDLTNKNEEDQLNKNIKSMMINLRLKFKEWLKGPLYNEYLEYLYPEKNTNKEKENAFKKIKYLQSQIEFFIKNVFIINSEKIIEIFKSMLYEEILKYEKIDLKDEKTKNKLNKESRNNLENIENNIKIIIEKIIQKFNKVLVKATQENFYCFYHEENKNSMYFVKLAKMIKKAFSENYFKKIENKREEYKNSIKNFNMKDLERYNSKMFDLKKQLDENNQLYEKIKDNPSFNKEIQKCKEKKENILKAINNNLNEEMEKWNDLNQRTEVFEKLFLPFMELVICDSFRVMTKDGKMHNMSKNPNLKDLIQLRIFDDKNAKFTVNYCMCASKAIKNIKSLIGNSRNLKENFKEFQKLVKNSLVEKYPSLKYCDCVLQEEELENTLKVINKELSECLTEYINSLFEKIISPINSLCDENIFIKQKKYTDILNKYFENANKSCKKLFADLNCELEKLIKIFDDKQNIENINKPINTPNEDIVNNNEKEDENLDKKQNTTINENKYEELLKFQDEDSDEE